MSMDTKTCTKCGESKPRTAEFYAADRRASDVLQSSCRECGRARCRAGYVPVDDAERKRRKSVSVEQKRAEKREYDAARYVERRPEALAVARAYVEANRETALAKKREKSKIDRQSPEWRGREAARLRADALARPEARRAARKKWREANPDYHVRKGAEWRAAHPEETRAKRRRRRLLAPDEHRALRPIEPGELCAYDCGRLATEVDHVWPVSRGGDNSPDNLVAACFQCNRSKGSKTLAEWLGFAEPARR